MASKKVIENLKERVNNFNILWEKINSSVIPIKEKEEIFLRLVNLFGEVDYGLVFDKETKKEFKDNKKTFEKYKDEFFSAKGADNSLGKIPGKFISKINLKWWENPETGDKLYIGLIVDFKRNYSKSGKFTGLMWKLKPGFKKWLFPTRVNRKKLTE